MGNRIQTDNRSNCKSHEAIMGGRVLYDFSILNLPQFRHLRMRVSGGCLTDPFANEFAFSSTVRDMFARCYDVDNKLEKNDLYFEEYPRFIYVLMERYAAQIHSACRNTPRDGVRLMFDWLLKTREIIEENYQDIPTLHLASDLVRKKDPQKCRSKETWPVKLNTYVLLYKYFRYRIENLLSQRPDSLANLILYNVWLEEYDKLREEYTGSFGLEFQKRAVVDVEDNKKYFFEVLVEQCMTFCKQRTADNRLMSLDDNFQLCDESMTRLLHAYFRDYTIRLQAQSNDADDIDAAIIYWFVDTLHGIIETYASNQEKVLRKCGRTQAVDVASMRFYLDICERNILEIAHDYFQDCERIPLIDVISKETKGEMHPRNEASFDGIEQKILDALDKAEATIDVCVAWFTNPKLRDKLLEKSNDGVEVRVITYKDGVNQTKGVDLSDLKHKKFRGVRSGVLHDKFCVIDNVHTINGSYNWTLNAEHKNDEDAAFHFEDYKLASRYTKRFNQMWKRDE